MTMKKSSLVLAGLALVASAQLSACSSDCLKCEGISATQIICKGDFQESADFNQYVTEYREQGGVCEEE